MPETAEVEVWIASHAAWILHGSYTHTTRETLYVLSGRVNSLTTWETLCVRGRIRVAAQGSLRAVTRVGCLLCSTHRRLKSRRRVKCILLLLRRPDCCTSRADRRRGAAAQINEPTVVYYSVVKFACLGESFVALLELAALL